MFRKKAKIKKLGEDVRIDGKNCFVTGANSGLGFAVAVALAKRGGRVWMACRRQIPEAGEKAKKLSGSESIEMIHLDLNDLASVDRCVEELKSKKISLDIVVSNAAAALPKARKSKYGWDEMFQVNYLGAFYLINRFLKEGLIPYKSIQQTKEKSQIPRIVFVSSETHRSGWDIDFEKLGTYSDFGFGQAVGYYGFYKLVLNTFSAELARRLQNNGRPDVSVHTLCPGPVNTNIIKEAPLPARWLIKLLFILFFRSPAKAAEPVVYLCCSPEMEGKSGGYLHYLHITEMDPRALNAENGQKLWGKSFSLLKSAGI